MPIIAHTDLPAFARLASEGVPITSPVDWWGPVLQVGLLNTMADGALEATERQFLRLLAAAIPDRGVLLHVFGLPEIPRNATARRHCDTYYASFAEVRAGRLDALIVTGANISVPDLGGLVHRDSLVAVLDWADAEVPTTLYSCLGTHAVLHFRHGKPRRLLREKRWGVFPHQLVLPDHPLLWGLPAVPVIPHSRWNDVPAGDFLAAGLEVLMVDAGDGGVHLAASRGQRHVFMQGHPEYEPVSLLKEHKREVALFADGLRPDYPEVPQGIVDPGGAAILADHRTRVEDAGRTGAPLPDYPEDAVRSHLQDTWRRDMERFMGNWLGRCGDPAR